MANRANLQSEFPAESKIWRASITRKNLRYDSILVKNNLQILDFSIVNVDLEDACVKAYKMDSIKDNSSLRRRDQRSNI